MQNIPFASGWFEANSFSSGISWWPTASLTFRLTPEGTGTTQGSQGAYR